EPGHLVRAVAERGDRRAAAPAQRNRPAHPLDGLAAHPDLDVAAHERGPVGIGRHGPSHRPSLTARSRRELAARTNRVPAYGIPPVSRSVSATHTHTPRSSTHGGAHSG